MQNNLQNHQSLRHFSKSERVNLDFSPAPHPINILATSTLTSSKATQLISKITKSCSNHLPAFVQLNILKMGKQNVAANSAFDKTSLAALDQKWAMARRCSHEGVIAGAKAAVAATIATAIPTMASVRLLPWARANLNHTAQALIISTVAGAAYFIVADKTVLATARRNSAINSMQ